MCDNVLIPALIDLDMSLKTHIYTLALAMAAMSAGGNLYGGGRVDNTKPYPKNADLPKWDYDGHRIFAKDEATAIKYAKKRGLYKEGVVPVMQ